MSHRSGDLPGCAHIAGRQVHVECDQRVARTDHRPAGCPDLAGSEIRLPLRVRTDLLFQGFILAPADVFQVSPLRGRGSLLVEVDRNVQFLSHPPAQAPGDLDAVLHRHLADRHERHHVSRPEAWVLALVLIQVDQFSRRGDPLIGSLLHRLRLSDEGQHCAVVIGVRVLVQHDHPRHPLDGSLDLLDHLRAARFGKIRDAFYDSIRHGCCSLPSRCHVFCKGFRVNVSF